MQLLNFTNKGICCKPAGVYIDPWRKVERAIITHAHMDHARPGHKHYLAHKLTAPVLKLRLGDVQVQEVEYGEEVVINGVKFSLHPAGHIPGSAQVRVEHNGEVWVVSGDYKTEDDGLSTPFEPVKCNTFITECTFGLPIYKWRPQQLIQQEINDWWRTNQTLGYTSVLMGYTLGKVQRLLHLLDPNCGKIFAHGAVYNTNEVLRQAGLVLPEAELITRDTDKKSLQGSLVIAPPSAQGTPWIKKFYPYVTGNASGWMALRGMRRRRAVDRGFVLSDHADWDGLLHAIKATGAECIYTTHGYTRTFSAYLQEIGYDARIVETEFGEEEEEVK